MVSEVVIDSSVLLALLKAEAYHLSVLDIIVGAVVSSVTLAEILAKASDFQLTDSPLLSELLGLLDRVEPFTESQANTAGALRAATRKAGLSLGDRACLALAMELGAEVYTADWAWAGVEVGCEVRLIR